MSTIFVGFFLAFYEGWQISLFILVLMPIMLIVSIPLHALLRKIADITIKAYIKAGGIAQ